MKLRMIPKPSAFVLMSDGTEFHMVITEAILSIWTLRVSPALELAHLTMVKQVNFRFPLRYTTMKYWAIEANSTTAFIDNMYLGPLPERITIIMVDNNAMNGNIRANPYNFKHNRLTYLCLTVNGQSKPRKPFSPNFVTHQYIRSYESLFAGTGTLNGNSSIDISRREYEGGYTIWIINLAPDQSDGDCLFPEKHGSVRCEIKLARGIANTVNVLCLAEFNTLLEIDQYKNVIPPRI